jgi:hypothetical protein
MHRKLCGSAEVQEQALPSQVALKKYREDVPSKIAKINKLRDIISFLVENSSSDSEDEP